MLVARAYQYVAHRLSILAPPRSLIYSRADNQPFIQGKFAAAMKKLQVLGQTGLTDCSDVRISLHMSQNSD